MNAPKPQDSMTASVDATRARFIASTHAPFTVTDTEIGKVTDTFKTFDGALFQANKLNNPATRAITQRDKPSFRIKAGHYYVHAEHPGISGFQDWSRKVESVIAAPKARNNRLSIVREYLANGLRSFRLCNGRLPEFQPVVREVDALQWLDENPFGEIVEVKEQQMSAK